MKINEINRVHLGAGNRGEAALRVIQSAHSEAQTETDEPERRMRVGTETLERGRDGGNKAADKKVGERETDEGKSNAERETRG